jgi:hypothetical protein
MESKLPTYTFSQRLKIALGGFISFTGMMVFACAILTLTGAVNLAIVFQGTIFVFIAAVVAGLNLVCGLLLLLGNKEIVLSFASDQNKTNNNAD